MGKTGEGKEVCGAIDGHSLSCKRGAEEDVLRGVCFVGKNRLIPGGKVRTEVIVESCMFGVCLDKSKGLSGSRRTKGGCCRKGTITLSGCSPIEDLIGCCLGVINIA